MNKVLLGIWLGILFPVWVYGQFSIADIPDPKQQGQGYYVSDPKGVLSTDELDSLNKIAAEIDRVGTAEVAIVLVDDFTGDDDFQFALDLFNTWGIGKKETSNGLLLFVATERRVYRFITGYGMESALPDAYLKRIGEHYMVPQFKVGNYGKGTLAAMGAIRQTLLSPDGLSDIQARMAREDSLWYRNRDVLINSLLALTLFFCAWKWAGFVLNKKILPAKRKKGKQRTNYMPLGIGCFVLGLFLFISIFVCAFLFEINPFSMFRFAYIPWYLVFLGSTGMLVVLAEDRKTIRVSFVDELDYSRALSSYYNYMLIPIILSPLALIYINKWLRSQKILKQRFLPPGDPGRWIRLNRAAIHKLADYLDKGQVCEEKLQSKKYEIWKDENTGNTKTIAWDGEHTRDFSLCPECGYFTLAKPTIKTIKAATYSAAGEGEQVQKCENCGHVLSLGMVVLPQKIRESSSSSSSSSGSSGGGSSSGGSWGGGSSGGGGAGGRW